MSLICFFVSSLTSPYNHNVIDSGVGVDAFWFIQFILTVGAHYTPSFDISIPWSKSIGFLYQLR